MTSENAPKKIEVVAMRMGYYGHKRRRQGDRFMLTLKDGEQLPTWVETKSDAAARSRIEKSNAEAAALNEGADGQDDEDEEAVL